MRTAAALALLLALTIVLGGCGRAGRGDDLRPPAPPPDPPPSILQADSGLSPGKDAIEVVAAVPPGQEVTAYALIGPEGEVARTKEFQRAYVERSGDRGRPTVGISGDSSGNFGIGMSLDLSNLFRKLPERESGRRTLLSGVLPLPDPAGYAESWRSYRIEVRYRDIVGDSRVLELRAPPP
ncbi:MAG: hypothetical protein WD489_05890 [Rhodovibrionaceae bacterium]